MSNKHANLSTLDYWTDWHEDLWIKEYHYHDEYSFEDFHNNDPLVFYKSLFQGEGFNLRIEEDSEDIKLLIMDTKLVSNHCALILRYHLKHE